MSKLLYDETGTYDLDEVAHITPIKRNDAQGKLIATHALLHSKSGAQHHTVTDYEAAVKMKHPPVETLDDKK